jgi:hypothetical protein
MRKFDKDGLILCEMQGQVFEMSIETTSTSSEIFIRRFMQSIIAKSLDSGDILQNFSYISCQQAKQLIFNRC